MRRLLTTGIGLAWLFCAPLGLAADPAGPALPPWAAAAARAKAPRFQWDVPGALERIEVPGEQHALGIPMKLHAVRSSWKLRELYQHFLTAFGRSELYITPPEHVKLPLSDPAVTALDPDRMISYTVIFQENPDGTVTCILGESHLGRRQPQDNFFAPVHPSAKSPLQTEVEGMRTLSYSASGTPAEIEGFYREGLKQQGYREVGALKFRKGRTLLQVQALREGGATKVLVIDSPSLPTAELETVE